MIYLDPKTGCYTDGRHYVKASVIRKYAREKMGLKQLRGKLSRDSIGAYFLDNFKVNDEVA